MGMVRYTTQVELLLGKAYAAWGHTGDAVAVYEGLIAEHPEDFRGYLAKVRCSKRDVLTMQGVRNVMFWPGKVFET